MVKILKGLTSVSFFLKHTFRNYTMRKDMLLIHILVRQMHDVGKAKTKVRANSKQVSNDSYLFLKL